MNIRYYTNINLLKYLNYSEGFDQGEVTGMLLIYRQKAFDTIDRNIILNELFFWGFSNSAILWFKSYLSNRSFIVNGENDYSGDLTCVVPQDYILGPLLVLLDINDIPSAIECELLLYADDSVLFTHKNIIIINDQTNRAFNSLCEWFVDNKVSIHFGSQFCLLVKVKIKVGKLAIHHIDIQINQFSKVTYLGCILDEYLSGQPNLAF